MFNAKRPRVVAKRTVGNTLNSSGAPTDSVVRSTMSDRAMLATRSKSTSAAGMGTNTTTKHAKMPAGTKKLRERRNIATSFSIGADFQFVLAFKPTEN
jgi:hypothetical protein